MQTVSEWKKQASSKTPLVNKGVISVSEWKKNKTVPSKIQTVSEWKKSQPIIIPSVTPSAPEENKLGILDRISSSITKNIFANQPKTVPVKPSVLDLPSTSISSTGYKPTPSLSGQELTRPSQEPESTNLYQKYWQKPWEKASLAMGQTIIDTVKNVGEKGSDLFYAAIDSTGKLDKSGKLEKTNLTKGERAVNIASKAGSLGTSIFAGIPSLLFTVPLSGAEQIPSIAPIAKGVNKSFEAVNEAMMPGANLTVDSLPISDKSKELARPLVQEAFGLFGMIMAGSAAHSIVKPKLDVLDAKIQKIILEDNKLRGKSPTWKPVMSEPEAKAFTSNSKVQETYYHGVDQTGASKIKSGGFIKSTDFPGNGAVSLTTNKAEAGNYAKLGTGKGEVLPVKINANNVKTFPNMEAYTKAIESMPGEGAGVKEAALLAKYDAVKIAGEDIMFVSNPKNLVVVSKPTPPSIPSIISEPIKNVIKGEKPIITEPIIKSEIPVQAKPIMSVTEWKDAGKPKIAEVPIPEIKVTPPVENLNSRVYERLQAELPEVLTENLTYEKSTRKAGIEKAVSLIEKDRQEAFNTAMGIKEGVPEVDSVYANITLAEKALQDGNNKLYAQLTKKRSLDQTRRGQAIEAEKSSVTDNSTSRYVKEVITARLEKLGKGSLDTINTTFKKASSKEKAINKIDTEVTKLDRKIKTKKLDVKTAMSLLDKLACI